MSAAGLVETREDLHHSFGPDFTRVEEVDSSGETVGLGEGTDDSDLVQEDLGGGPGDSGVIGVDSVDEESSTSGNVVDGVVDDRLDTSALGDNVETVLSVSRVLDIRLSHVRGFSFLIWAHCSAALPRSRSM
jgi:hypothetical protein